MTRAKRCDRCRCFYESYMVLNEGYAITAHAPGRRKTIDLCPGCHKDLAAWMEKYKEEAADDQTDDSHPGI